MSRLISRLRLMGLLALAAAASVFAQPYPQHYPYKPVRIVTGFGPRGFTDVIARIAAHRLSEVFKQSFVYLSLLAEGPFVLVVHPSVPATSASALIELARVRPGRLTYGYPGVGSFNHLAALPGYEYTGAIGLSAPAGTPLEIALRLNAAIVNVVNAEDTRDAILRTGFEPRTSSIEQYTAFIRADIANVAAVVRAAGLRAE